jgi:purine-nucleoside phosphorylase
LGTTFPPTDSGFEAIEEAAEAIQRRSLLTPAIAVILGSGLGPLADEVEDAVSIPYVDIPHFVPSTAPGHAGRLILGTLAGVPVVVMAGRIHLYEGYTAQQVVFPVRTMSHLGAQTLVVTNAAGGVNLDFREGCLMLISDHINLTGQNPLVGAHEARLGARFPDMTQAYHPDLRVLAHNVAREQHLSLAEGVYLGLLGPSYETPAEIRMARMLGADAVGMSTVMEVIAANHVGMRVLGISCITNMAAGILLRTLTEEEVLETAASVRAEFVALVTEIIRRLRYGYEG